MREHYKMRSPDFLAGDRRVRIGADALAGSLPPCGVRREFNRRACARLLPTNASRDAARLAGLRTGKGEFTALPTLPPTGMSEEPFFL